ncbi:hypothetical protein YC2023_084410 [Brassica napus]
MDIPELPRRIHTLGEDPPAVHSISYHTCWTLHTALKKALHDDEYEELKESKLGVFIKFQELGFDWASRLVHYMLGFQLDIKKKYELWSLVGPESVRFSLLEFKNLTGLNCEYIEDLETPHCVVSKELTSFWEMLGVHVEAGPSTQEIIAAFERCEGWSRDDRKQLAVLMDSVKGRDISGCYTINGFAQALQGRKGRKQFKEAILIHIFYLLQTRVINFVQKDIGEMFPKWEFDVEDTPSENIIKLMFPAVVSPAKKNVVKEDSPRPRKKARKEASEEAAAEASEEVHTTVGGDIVDAMREGFGTCLKEIKYLSERVEAVEKKSESVNGTNAGRKSLPEDKSPDVPADASSSKDKAPEPSLVLLDKNQSTVSDLQKEDARYLEKRDAALVLCRAESDRTRKIAASQQSPYTANSRAKVIIPNKKLYPGYNPFAPIDKKKLKELADWLKTCPHYRTPLDKKPRTSRTWWYQILRTSLEWLEDCVWGTDIDDVYAPVNYNDTHWIAMWISIPKRHIVVWNSICSSISPEDLDVVMEHFLYMVPYLLVECASSDEQRAQYNLEPFTYERPTNIPPARAGDCGVYTLKYIECHALGIEFSKKEFAKANGKTMRDKMAVDIFQELPDAHEFENKDNDANLGAYEG